MYIWFRLNSWETRKPRILGVATQIIPGSAGTSLVRVACNLKEDENGLMDGWIQDRPSRNSVAYWEQNDCFGWFVSSSGERFCLKL